MRNENGENLKVLLTGGSGLFGRSLIRTAPPEMDIVAVARRQVSVPPRSRARVRFEMIDVTDKDLVRDLFRRHSFDAVIHGAGEGSVDQVEQDPEKARKSIVESVGHVLDAARGDEYVALLSSNAVFDGKRAPYSETDERSSVSKYGELKIAAEDLLLSSSISGSVIRPILSYGWAPPNGRDNPVSFVVKQLRAGQKVKMVTDVRENPLYVDQGTKAIWVAVQKRLPDVFHLAGSDVVNRYELALAVAESFNMNRSLIEPATTDDFPSLVKRPPDTTLVTTRMEQVLGVRPLALAEGLREMAEVREP